VCYIAKIKEHVIATSLAIRFEWVLKTLLLLVEVVGRNVLGKCTEERQGKYEGTGFRSYRRSINWQFK
jgi:hypothetical protein